MLTPKTQIGINGTFPHRTDFWTLHLGGKNPVLAEQRNRKRKELLQATENQLEPIRLATLRKQNPLRGENEIGLRVGKVIGRHKMAKHVELRTNWARFAATACASPSLIRRSIS